MANKSRDCAQFSKEQMDQCNEFYSACEYNDRVRAKYVLSKMTLKEINYQYAPNNETVLHVATRKQQKDIIELLLMYAANTQIRDANGKLASELAKTDEIKQLFQRPEFPHSVFPSYNVNSSVLSQQKLNCKSCSIINKDSMYEWEIIDRSAAQKALKFRREFEAYASTDGKIWKKKLYSLNKSYLNAHIQDLGPFDSISIRTCFKNAFIEENPDYLVTAYSHSQRFSNMLNIDMARNVIHSLRNGCSQFSCQCLYETQDGTTVFSSILLHHPNFQELNYQGIVYRGIFMPKQKLDHYKVGLCVVTTFLSTSKDPYIANLFTGDGMSQLDKHSFLCTYKLTTNGRTGIDISKLSKFSNENEVLILPYSSFLITKIEEGRDVTNIYLEEQSLPEFIQR